MRGIDLYSGIGGWTLGMKFSGLENVYSYEWNKDSNTTHNMNFGTSIEEVDIRKLDLKTLPNPKELDFVVGSPPCTQFSYSNRGGSGDISDGLVDIHKFFEIVHYIKPKYWVMENVPRVKKIIDQVLEFDKNFKKFKHLVKFNEVVDVSDYGVPQKRKRMICGDFPFEYFKSYKGLIPKNTLGKVVNLLQKDKIIDPNYGFTSIEQITEHNKETYLTKTETRINRNNKTFHHIYNKMSFPDKLDFPSRTITSTCTRVSRESIIVKEKNNYRRLTLREKGCVQGFPINYEFFGSSHSSKEKMIGNSIPPILTYFIFESFKKTNPENVILPQEFKKNVFLFSDQKPKKTLPPFPRSNYRDDRRFRFCIPNLRFGSGVRFEMENMSKKNNWKISFFYGNSKQIFLTKLDKVIKDFIEEELGLSLDSFFSNHKDLLQLKSSELQKFWTSKDNNYYPFSVIDRIGDLVLSIDEQLSNIEYNQEKFYLLFDGKISEKLISNFSLILTGMIIGCTINENIKHGS